MVTATKSYRPHSKAALSKFNTWLEPAQADLYNEPLFGRSSFDYAIVIHDVKFQRKNHVEKGEQTTKCVVELNAGLYASDGKKLKALTGLSEQTCPALARDDDYRVKHWPALGVALDQAIEKISTE